MATKKDTKATADEEAAEQAFLAKQAKKPKAQAQEGDIQPREGEEFLPPPDPPTVESPPFPPPAPDAVEDIPQKGADPEVETLRELNIVIEGTPGEGPRPEESAEPKKGEEKNA